MESGLRGENFNYHKDKLVSAGLKVFATDEGKVVAKKYARDTPKGQLPEANQIILANYAYGFHYGTGKNFKNTGTNDGWNFRGRGLLQITGRSNYKVIQDTINKISSGSGIDIYKKYDTPNNAVSIANGYMTMEEAVLTGLADWYKDKMYVQADRTGTKGDDDVVNLIVDIINSGTTSREKRQNHYKKTKVTFLVDSCKNIYKKEKKKSCNDDFSQCFEYADVWDNPEISSDNGGKNNNRFGHNSKRGHKGLDILSGAKYKEVHSTMCGKVTAIVDTFKTNEYKKSSLGNTVMIKSKNKEGKTVFMLYCHLDKIYVKKGDKVSHGQKIALSGSTGNAAEILDLNGNLKNGIRKKNWHVHIEAATQGDGYNNFYSLGAYRIQPEDYMKTKFDEDGNTIK